MPYKEKTQIAVYLYATIAVLFAALALRGTKEPFQATPTVKCVSADGASMCRFIDEASSTKETLVIREQTTSVPQYVFCPKTSDGKDTLFNPNTFACVAPSDSADKDKLPPLADVTKITCPKADEKLYPAMRKCTSIVGTVPRCIPDAATKDTAEVKTAMSCYAKRYADTNAVSKLGSDTALLWDDWINLGVFNLRNPCCDAAVAPVPVGSIRIGDTVIEKDWKFWTMIGLGSALILAILIAAVT